MDNLRVKNLGPILEADIRFGDLTIFVGPQASGKSLLLEFFKLIKDQCCIRKVLTDYNYVIPSKTEAKTMARLYFGGELSYLIDDTEVVIDGEPFDFNHIGKSSGCHRNGEKSEEEVFYIPAQRILSIDDGRPRTFMEFSNSTPYVLRRFSELLRIYIQSGLGNPDVLFPMAGSMESGIVRSIDNSIFHGGQVIMDTRDGQRKMKLDVNGLKLPFIRWSAGQKEFMPLLLSFYCLSNFHSSIINTTGYKWVIIEEPEMGLHPKAMESVILEIMALMNSGYKVIISTHSPTFLDFAWTMKSLAGIDRKNLREALDKLFERNSSDHLNQVFESMTGKEIKTYYFHPTDNGVVTQDISTLDVSDTRQTVSEWGGVAGFASRASDVVSQYIPLD